MSTTLAARREPAHPTITALEALPIFAGVPPNQLRHLAEQGKRRSFRARSIVIQEGAESTSLFIIVSGRVRIFASDGGKRVTLSVREAGESFGELALLGDTRRPTSVMTLSPTELLVVPRQSLVDLMETSPRFACNVGRELSRLGNTLIEHVKSFALKDVFGRLVGTLYELARPADGCHVIDERITHQDLAERVGASRAMVGRIMKDLAIGGYVTLDADRLVIHKRLPARW